MNLFERVLERMYLGLFLIILIVYFTNATSVVRVRDKMRENVGVERD